VLVVYLVSARAPEPSRLAHIRKPGERSAKAAGPIKYRVTDSRDDVQNRLPAVQVDALPVAAFELQWIGAEFAPNGDVDVGDVVGGFSAPQKPDSSVWLGRKSRDVITARKRSSIIEALW
jgi:hypothetical protein